MRKAEVTLRATGAWETWDVLLPDDAPTDPAELKDWMIENLGDVDKTMAECGADSYEVEDVTEAD